jgi:hypothetical protein
MSSTAGLQHPQAFARERKGLVPSAARWLMLATPRKMAKREQPAIGHRLEPCGVLTNPK